MHGRFFCKGQYPRPFASKRRSLCFVLFHVTSISWATQDQVWEGWRNFKGLSLTEEITSFSASFLITYLLPDICVRNKVIYPTEIYLSHLLLYFG